MKLNCKVIKKVAKPPPPPLYINSPFSGLSPFLATILEPPSQVSQFLGGPTPFNKVGGGVPTMCLLL